MPFDRNRMAFHKRWMAKVNFCAADDGYFCELFVDKSFHTVLKTKRYLVEITLLPIKHITTFDP